MAKGLEVMNPAESVSPPSSAVPSVTELLDLDEMPTIEAGRINAIVMCYNERVRLPYFLEFYQSLGVERFIVVDNASTDGSDAILDANPAVTRFCSRRAFAEHKTIWRHALADTYLSNRWVLFPDVDELLVYPGWPERSLHWLADYMEQRGYDALFAPMVDMYSDKSLSELHYEPGESFIEACPYFDTGNYRQIPQTTSVKKWKTPPYRIHGGARERLFHPGKARQPNLTDQMLLRLFFSLGRNTNPGQTRRNWEKRALDRLDGCFPEKPPNMSKVPFLRWRPNTRFQGSPHRVNFEYDLAPDWGTILHFKYLHDFEIKVDDAVARGQHMSQALHYKLYQQQLPELQSNPLTFKGSKKFEGWKSLVKAGLMRVSPALGRRLRTAPDD